MKKNQGMSLIELIIVIGILAIIAAIAIPNLHKAHLRNQIIELRPGKNVTEGLVEEVGRIKHEKDISTEEALIIALGEEEDAVAIDINAKIIVQKSEVEFESESGQNIKQYWLCIKIMEYQCIWVQVTEESFAKSELFDTYNIQ